MPMLLRHSPPAAARTQLPRWLSLKGAAVVLILAMHALGLYFLLLPPRQLKQYTEVAFMTLMPPRPLPRTPPMPLPMPMPRARAVAPAVPNVPTVSTIAATPAQTESAPVTAEAITAPAAEQAAAPASVPSTDDLRTRARLAAGAADKALRGELKKDKPWLAAPELPGESKFQKLVASAWRGGPVLTVEDYLTADGRPASRVRTPGGSSCFAMADNPGAGADPFKTGGKLKMVPCPS